MPIKCAERLLDFRKFPVLLGYTYLLNVEKKSSQSFCVVYLGIHFLLYVPKYSFIRTYLSTYQFRIEYHL